VKFVLRNLPTKNPDRWRQRLQNLNKAFGRLHAACAQERYNDLELSGLAHIYKFTFELCWKTPRDKLVFEGYEANSPREAIPRAFQMGLLADAAPWLIGPCEPQIVHRFRGFSQKPRHGRVFSKQPWA
jgi:hypothetical protein